MLSRKPELSSDLVRKKYFGPDQKPKAPPHWISNGPCLIIFNLCSKAKEWKSNNLIINSGYILCEAWSYLSFCWRCVAVDLVIKRTFPYYFIIFLSSFIDCIATLYSRSGFSKILPVKTKIQHILKYLHNIKKFNVYVWKRVWCKYKHIFFLRAIGD